MSSSGVRCASGVFMSAGPIGNSPAQCALVTKQITPLVAQLQNLNMMAGYFHFYLPVTNLPTDVSPLPAQPVSAVVAVGASVKFGKYKGLLVDSKQPEHSPEFKLPAGLDGARVSVHWGIGASFNDARFALRLTDMIPATTTTPATTSTKFLGFTDNWGYIVTDMKSTESLAIVNVGNTTATLSSTYQNNGPQGYLTIEVVANKSTNMV